MFFVNYLPEFLYQTLKLSNVRPTEFANSKHALYLYLLSKRLRVHSELLKFRGRYKEPEF